jgi:hypothetical protein
MQNHTYRRIKVGNIQPNSYQQRNGGYFMSIELRYHPLIANRTCKSWDCPTFKDIHFEDMVITGTFSSSTLRPHPRSLYSHHSFQRTQEQLVRVTSTALRATCCTG